MSIDEDSSNEDILREGECPAHNCIEAAGHAGDHFPGIAQRVMSETAGPMEAQVIDLLGPETVWLPGTTTQRLYPAAREQDAERAALEQRVEQAVMVGERAASAAEQLIADKTALEQRCRTLEAALRGLVEKFDEYDPDETGYAGFPVAIAREVLAQPQEATP